MSRILVIGGPRSGKTTLATALAELTGYTLISTDSYIHLAPFSDVPELVRSDAMKHENVIVEGVNAPRVPKLGMHFDIVVKLENYSKSPKHAGLNSLADNFKGRVHFSFSRPFNAARAASDIVSSQ